MVKVGIKGKELIEDLAGLVNSTYNTGVCALSVLGLEYISEHCFGSPAYELFNPDLPIFSYELGIYFAQLGCGFGTLMNGLSAVSEAVSIPVKLISGKYIKKRKSKAKKLKTTSSK